MEGGRNTIRNNVWNSIDTTYIQELMDYIQSLNNQKASYFCQFPSLIGSGITNFGPTKLTYVSHNLLLVVSSRKAIDCSCGVL